MKNLIFHILQLSFLQKNSEKPKREIGTQAFFHPAEIEELILQNCFEEIDQEIFKVVNK